MTTKIISYSFYALFFLTPLFWTSVNHELFEYSKMLLVYAFTTIIIGSWLLKAINDKQLTIKRTPLDIPLLLFLGANILSTIFSIDPHTSVWGYYSRANGGLLSIISYILLYFAYVANMSWDQTKTALKFGLISGFIISLWGISEHFGVSPSCVILRGEFNASCWIQVVQDRVFATLGQPNWMAAYLAMLIFPALYFLITATSKSQTIIYYLLSITFYLAFTFTYSRGPTLGLLGGMAVFTVALFSSHLRGVKAHLGGGLKPLFIVLGSFLALNLLFGSALTSFRLISKFAAPSRPGINLTTAPSVGTQLENGGTESGQIRLIVWKGAMEVFKHYPIFGSGVETFAYSYYQYRPVEHNLTSEWDFLYNKAHNEYLNYLATTGIVGTGTYLLFIIYFVFWSIKKLIKSNRANGQMIFVAAILAAYISYLIYNFFLFSVVIIAVFFFLFPALVFVATESTKPLKLPTFLLRTTNYLLQTIYRRPFYTQAAKTTVVLISLYFLYSIFQIWYADTIFTKGEKAYDAGNAGRAYNYLSAAVDINRGEPYYRSELGFAAAEAAAALAESDATLSASLKEEAVAQTNKVLKENPKNVSYFRTAVRTYFELSTIDKSYIDKTLAALDSAIKLAPTDPKLYYNKALVLDATNKKDEEIKVLQEAVRLKPNYLEALTQLNEATNSGESK